MYTKVLLFGLALISLQCLVICDPTMCLLWKGRSEIRCAKDNYRADSVAIQNTSNDFISFNVGKWISQCGRPGTNYYGEEFKLGNGGKVEIDFSEARRGDCNEIFVHGCRRLGEDVNCIDILSVKPL